MRTTSIIYLVLGIIGVLFGLLVIGGSLLAGDSTYIFYGVILVIGGLIRGGWSVARLIAWNQATKAQNIHAQQQAQRIMYAPPQANYPGYPPQGYGQPGYPPQPNYPGYPPQQPAYPPQPGQYGQYGQPGQPSQYGSQFAPQQPAPGSDIPPNPYNQR